MADSNPAPVAPSMAGVAQNTGDQQAQILGAIAKYGQAGADAYTNAQNAVQANRQSLLSSLANSQGIGGDAAALLRSQAQNATAPALSELQTGAANLQGDLARSNQMYTNYANEANAAIPVIQGNTQNLMTIRDAALQQAQQQLDAQAKAQAAQNAQDLALKQMDLQIAQQNAAKASTTAQAAAAKATATKAPTSNDLFGAAKALADQGAVTPDQTAAEVSSKTPLTNDMLMTAQDQAAYAQNGDTRYSTDPAVNLAKEFGQAYGLAPDQINSIVTPQAIKAYENAQPAPPSPDDLKAATTALKGDSGGANAVLNGSRWPAVQQAVNAIATAPRDANGLIADGSAYNGMKPWDAFSKWVTSPAAQLAPGDTKTPQVATAFYKSFLSALK